MPLVLPTLAALSAAMQGGHESEALEVLTALVEVAHDLVSRFRVPKRSGPHIHMIASLK